MRCFAQFSIGSVKNPARQLMNVLPQYTSTTVASACSSSPCWSWLAEGLHLGQYSLFTLFHVLAREGASVGAAHRVIVRAHRRPGPCRWEW